MTVITLLFSDYYITSLLAQINGHDKIIELYLRISLQHENNLFRLNIGKVIGLQEILLYCSTEAGQRSTTEPCFAVHMIFDVETIVYLLREAKNWVTHGLGSLGFISTTSIPAQNYTPWYILCSLSVPPPHPLNAQRGDFFFVHKQLITWFSDFFIHLTAIRLFRELLIFTDS